jgi:hypothetical protein
MKQHGINLTKETKDLFNENCKPLKKEIKLDIRRWKDLQYSWISRLNTAKMAILSKAIDVLNKTIIQNRWNNKSLP